jgi:hypothetical protein
MRARVETNVSHKAITDPRPFPKMLTTIFISETLIHSAGRGRELIFPTFIVHIKRLWAFARELPVAVKEGADPAPQTIVIMDASGAGKVAIRDVLPSHLSA